MLLLSNQGMLNGLTTSENKSIKGMRIQLDHGSSWIRIPLILLFSEWVDNFRKQEYQRYANPTRPWIYVCEDGRKVTVAPVAKKLSVLTGKPRYHAMLKN